MNYMTPDATPDYTQAEAVEAFLPLILSTGKTYSKKTTVWARKAVVGERVITVTTSGKETENVAKEGDYLIENDTVPKEHYLISGEKFKIRYSLLDFIDPRKTLSLTGETFTWNQYKAIGSVIGLPYTGDPLKFIAAWNEPMVLFDGDMICTPLPGKDEVYRIGRPEFIQTYGDI
jgi:hypothetical protein